MLPCLSGFYFLYVLSSMEFTKEKQQSEHGRQRFYYRRMFPCFSGFYFLYISSSTKFIKEKQQVHDIPPYGNKSFFWPGDLRNDRLNEQTYGQDDRLIKKTLFRALLKTSVTRRGLPKEGVMTIFKKGTHSQIAGKYTIEIKLTNIWTLFSHFTTEGQKRLGNKHKQIKWQK